MRQIPLAEASMDGIAGRLLSRSIQDLPLDEPILAAEHYRKTTAVQIAMPSKNGYVLKALYML